MDKSIAMWDVIIIGAGLSGLKAAIELKNAGKKVLVLEARDHVGGRAMPGEIQGHTIDLGGQWVGPQQKLLLSQAKALNVTTYSQYHQGASLLSWNHQVTPYHFEIPKLPWLALIELLIIERRWHHNIQYLKSNDIQSSPKIKKWDAQTVADWTNHHVRHSAAQDFIHTMVSGLLCCTSSQVSYLFFLDCLRKGHGLWAMMKVKGGAQQDKFLGGAWQIPKRMADQLKDDIQLNTPVDTIIQSSQHVQIRSQHQEYVARHVIMTAPPPLASSIDYRPALPEQRMQLLQRMKMGAVIKIHVAYRSAFWRKTGLNGMVASADRHLSLVFDQSPTDESCGILVGLIEAEHAIEMSQMDSNLRRQQIISDLVYYFGEAAAEPLEYIEQDWIKEQWSQGGYAAHMPPHVLSTLGHLIREPIGRIHWAGTETATEWMGYLDGALQSGIRAAQEVISAQLEVH